MPQKDTSNEILRIIKKIKNKDDFKEQILKFHPYDVASIFDSIEESDRQKLYRLLSPEEFADIFEQIGVEEAAEYIKEMDEDFAISLMEEVDNDDAADIIQAIDDDEIQKSIKDSLSREKTESVDELSKYHSSLAGSIMTNSFIAVKSGITVKDAMKEVVVQAPDAEVVNDIFVVNDLNELEGVISLADLIIARGHVMISDVVKPHFKFVKTRDDMDYVLSVIRDYDVNTVPVINTANKLRGVITVDDALDELIEAKDSDYAKLAGLTDSDFQGDSEKITYSVRKRLPWLVILLLVGMLVSIVISGFQDTLNALPILALFMPLILGLAGNGGTQALAVTVRKLSDTSFETDKKVFQHLFRELRIGALNGLLVGIFAYFVVSVLLFIGGTDANQSIAIVVACAAGVALTASTLAGAGIPILISKLKIDPAVASGPFISTLNDLIAVLVYFGLATLFLL